MIFEKCSRCRTSNRDDPTKKTCNACRIKVATYTQNCISKDPEWLNKKYQRDAKSRKIRDQDIYHRAARLIKDRERRKRNRDKLKNKINDND